MGGTPSVNLNVPDKLNYFSISFDQTDRLRLMFAPEEIIQTTERILTTYWSIQDKARSNGFFEFKLSGRPWSCYGEDKLNVNFFICVLLKDFYMLGWNNLVSSKLNRNGYCCSVLIFEKIVPISTYVMCLSLNSSDLIRVLGPEDLISEIKNVIISNWPKGIQNESRFEKSYEFKLFGNPWISQGLLTDDSDFFFGNLLINEIMSVLYKRGWLFINSIDSFEREDLNSLYFKYSPSEVIPQSEFFAFLLHSSDSIRLIKPPSNIIFDVKNKIIQSWSQGIQEENKIFLDKGYGFKLHGNPWSNVGNDAVFSRILISNLLDFFSKINWKLYGTSNLSRSLTRKSSFFFRWSPDSLIPRNSITSCISLNEGDKIRIIFGDDNLNNLVRQAIVHGWPNGIQEESIYHGSKEFKLNGYPWTPYRNEDVVYAYSMMTFLLSFVQSSGYKFICSADTSSKYHSDKYRSYPFDLHSWFLEKNN